jgi:hypothetical protein
LSPILVKAPWKAAADVGEKAGNTISKAASDLGNPVDHLKETGSATKNGFVKALGAFGELFGSDSK